MKVTLLITGATGFIGYMLAADILQKDGKISIGNNGNENFEERIKRLILFVRDREKAYTLLQKELSHTKVEVVFREGRVEDIPLNSISERIDYMIHCASVTKSSEMITYPIEVADTIVLGTHNILELARQKKVKSMVYLSSMEIYGNVESKEQLVEEDELGDINLLAVRSCYPVGKRMAEHYCYLYFKEYSVPVKIARLAQTFGIGVPLTDNRIFAQFAKAVIQNKDIVLHTLGRSVGNYCEIGDTVCALWTLLLKGESGEAYNVVNESNTMKIHDMASMVAEKVAKGKIKVVYEITSGNIQKYASDTELRLSSKKLRALGWQPTKNLEEMYQDLIYWYQQQEYN